MSKMTERMIQRVAANHTKEAASEEILNFVLPMAKVYVLLDKLEKEEPITAKLTQDVLFEISNRLEIPDNTMEAINRLRNTANNNGRWDIDLMRNNLFKAAHALGIKLPHGMF